MQRQSLIQATELDSKPAKTTGEFSHNSVLTTFPILYAICMRNHRIIIVNVVEQQACKDNRRGR